MRIRSVYLKGYKPLAHLSNIDSIYIDMLSDITLILGTNGCGKSSLLREMTPLPANNNDYKDGGEKRIYIEHKDSQYELRSVMSKGGKHTFIKDGVELLSAGNATLQRELVAKEFAYSALIHKLLIGEIQFTSMSVAMRREILTTISPLDLTYAIKVHNSTKVALRDTQAVLKHISAKKTDAQQRLLELKVIDDIDQINANLESQLNNLIPYTTANLASSKDLINLINEDYKRLKHLRLRVNNFDNTRVPNSGINTIEELNQYIGNCVGLITASQATIANLSTELEKLIGIGNSLTDNHLSLEDITQCIASCSVEINKLPATCFVSNNHDKFLLSLTELSNSLDIIFDEIASVTIYAEPQRITYTEAYRTSKETKIKLELRLSNIETDLRHYSDPSAIINCPKCQFKFNRKGESVEDTVYLLNTEKEDLTNKLDVCIKDLTRLSRIMEEIQAYENCINRIQILRRNIYLPSEFWVYTNEEVILSRAKISTHILQWYNNIVAGKHRVELEAELLSYQNALAIYNKYGSSVDSKIKTLEQNLDNEVFKRISLQNNLETAKRVLKNYTNYINIASEVEKEMVILDNHFKALINSTIQEDAKQKRSIVYEELSHNSQILNQKNTLINTIADLDLEYSAMVERNAALTILEEHLSQNKGLIADQMLSFIGSYVSEINSICADIFSYDLSLKMCTMDNGSLDYKFPLLVENDSVSDIALGSTGQCEVIDLAFMLVMRQYLGLSTYPLYLDETGASFDEIHRTALMDYLKKIMGMDSCSQLFIINHYTNIHGGLTNHDTVVLDDRNITVPNSYNEHVVLEYI